MTVFDVARSRSVRVVFGQIAFSGSSRLHSFFANHKNLLNRNPRIDAIMGSRGIDSKIARCSVNREEIHSINRYGLKAPLVLRTLNMRGYPAAVICLVISIWVHPVNLMLRAWLGSHVSEKCRERGIPLFAQNYPSSAVLWIILALGIVATPFNAKPSLVLWACIASLFVSVSNYTRHLNLMSYVVNCSKSPLTRQEAHV